MFKFLTLLILGFSFSMVAQSSIHSENYYSYYKDHTDYKKYQPKKLSTARLNELEVAAILHQEMKLAGFEWLSLFRIVHLDDEKHIVSICYSEKSKFGFVFDGSFNAIPDKKVRDLAKHSKNDEGYEYVEKIVGLKGNSKFIKVSQLPENLYLIRSDIYWYQESENEPLNKTIVTKDIITQILREDIRIILKSVKK